MSWVVALLCTSLSWGMTDAYVPHLSRAVHFHVPSRQAIDQLLQGRLVTPATFPVQQQPGVTIQGLPNPEFLPFLLHVMPHLIQFEDDASPRGLWLLLELLGQGSDPVEHRPF